LKNKRREIKMQKAVVIRFEVMDTTSKDMPGVVFPIHRARSINMAILQRIDEIKKQNKNIGLVGIDINE